MNERRREACSLVDEIRQAGGGATQEDIEFMRINRPGLLKSFYSLQAQVAGSAKTVSEQLNSQDDHYIYELIQNAEDNRYLDQVQPCLTFTLRKDRLIVDSNEVGFTPKNIEAISQVGQSTKARKSGFIGEKGIGFKSVFRVARKVHIQSEPYSFAFLYNKKEDSGLGMVTPLNEPFLHVPEGIQTRMILYFKDDASVTTTKEGLQKLPRTLLLFLKKLKRLTINIELGCSDDGSITYSRKPNLLTTPKGRVTIVKYEAASSYEYHFWVRTRMVNDMPHHDAREEIGAAEIAVAFPLDADDRPIIEYQLISAYLPLRKEHFKFLIQSDFITGANREDVLDCEWNTHLRSAIAQLFISSFNSTDGFWKHDTLRFNWVRYIPTEIITHEFWGKLQQQIFQSLQLREFYAAASEPGKTNWKAPKKLRILPEIYRDRNSNPLLPDLDSGPTAYVSEDYDKELDLPVLRQLGTTNLSASPDFVSRLRQDLRNGDRSKWKNTDYTDDWFMRMSNVLMKFMGDVKFKETIQLLELVPLTTGPWVAPLNGSLFYPNSDGVDIPKGLGLSLLENATLGNAALKNLFTALGAKTCSPSQVIPMIEQRYRSGGRLKDEVLVQDIVYLFWYNQMVPDTEYSISLSYNQGTGFFYGDVKNGGWWYDIRSLDRYSLYNIVGGKVPEDLHGKLSFPKNIYFDALEKCPLRNGKNGLDWLRERAGIKIVPQLQIRAQNSSTARQTREMSAEFKFIAEQMPQYLLGVLERGWLQYVKSEEWDQYVRAIEVPVLESPREKPLNTTFLPLPGLKNIAKKLGLEAGFGFLEELDGMEELDSVKWNFLKHFGVGVKDDLHFWLALLYKAKAQSGTSIATVIEIYTHIQTFMKEDDIRKVRHAFETDELCFIPSGGNQGIWTWVGRKGVVWKGPKWFTTPQPLANLAEYQTLYGLFVIMNQVSDINIDHCLANLYDIYIDEEDLENVPLLYSKLEELLKTSTDVEADKKKIKSKFEESTLIWHPPSQEWYSPLDCVWAEDNIALPNKASLIATYAKQSTFFRDILGVKKPSVDMHIASLMEKASEDPNKSDILQEMRNITALGAESEILRNRLADCLCFPIKTPVGDILWQSSTADFAISDRSDYTTLFQGKLSMLNFTLEEVHSVRPFLEGLNLGCRMLSECVTEKTQAEESQLSSSRTADLRSKAYAITRYLAHLGATNPLKIFSQLSELEVFTSNKISRSLTVKQSRKKISVPTATAFFHLESVNEQPKLYIPQDNDQQQVCLVRHLPISLLRFFGVQARNRGVELSSIITATNLSIVDTILEQDGVIEIDGVSKPRTAEPQHEAVLEATATEPEILGATSTMRGSTRAPGLYRLQDSIYADEPLWPIETIENGFDYEDANINNQPDLFNKLISFVIEQAKLIDELPKKGYHVLASRNSGSDFDHALAVEMNVHGKAWRKIGAVGELFVFTLLTKLALPNFRRTCWQSTIRHLVAVHERYSDLARWTGTETSDIVYFDSESTLTNLLIRQGYLPRDSWDRRTPTYYIEVKTTMGDVDRPFYCSQEQFERMENMTLPDDGRAADEVYLVARVFGVGSSRMGLKLYLDPWKMRRRQLRFEAQVYSVTTC